MRTVLVYFCFVFALSGVAALPVGADTTTPADAVTPAAPTAKTAQANRILEQLEQARARLNALASERSKASGDQRKVLERQYQDEELQIGALAHDLGELVVSAGEDASSLGASRQVALEVLEQFPALLERMLDEHRATLEQALNARDSAPPEQLLQAEQAVTAASAAYDQSVDYYVRHLELSDDLGIDTTDISAGLLARLDEQAGRVAARINLIADEKQELDRHISANPDDTAAKERAVVLSERFDSMVASLRREVGLLDRLGGDSSDYRKLLVTSTGDISAIGLDSGVAASLIEDWVQSAKDWFANNALTLLLRSMVIVMILVGTWILSGIAKRLVHRALLAANANVSQLLNDMLVNMTSKIVLLLGVLVALSQIGISVGPMLAGLGIAGFIVGFALQDTLGNFASGVLILFYRPFDVGDVIEAAGVLGSVSAMSLVSTTILTPDHQTLIVPNKMIWGGVIRNITLQKQRRVDLIFGIAYGDDVGRAEEVLRALVASHPKVLAEPQPVIRLHELAESSVNFCVRPWVRTEDYWEVYWDLTRTVKLRFDEAGLTIPFPQREVHLRSAAS